GLGLILADFISASSIACPPAPSTTTASTLALLMKFNTHPLPFRVDWQSIASTNTSPSSVLTAILIATLTPSLPYLITTNKLEVSFGNSSTNIDCHSSSVIADLTLYDTQ